MNPKDYKAIAEIMKWCPNAFVTIGYKEGLEDGRKHFVNDLADYFVRKYGQHICNCGRTNNHHWQCDILENFDKEQFLKDCEAEK